MATKKNKKKAATPKKPAPRNSATPRSAAGRHPAGRTPAGRRASAGPPAARLPSGRKDESFFDLVHEVARQIPRGRVSSYGAIAAVLGTRMSARMVGWAMNACHSAKKPVPAHRVVNRNGLLTGKHHFNPPSKMEQLLKKEGIKVKDDKIVGFAELFWDPASELI